MNTYAGYISVSNSLGRKTVKHAIQADTLEDAIAKTKRYMSFAYPPHYGFGDYHIQLNPMSDEELYKFTKNW